MTIITSVLRNIFFLEGKSTQEGLERMLNYGLDTEKDEKAIELARQVLEAAYGGVTGGGASDPGMGDWASCADCAGWASWASCADCRYGMPL